MTVKEFDVNRLRDILAAVGEFAPALLLMLERLANILKRPDPPPAPTVQGTVGRCDHPCAVACLDAAGEAQLEALAAVFRARRCCTPEDDA